jgi:hypothetical protein
MVDRLANLSSVETAHTQGVAAAQLEMRRLAVVVRQTLRNTR